MGRINQKQLPKDLQFAIFSDEKLRLALMGMADKYDQKIRDLIYKTYSDGSLTLIYNRIRNSGIYEGGSKTGARHRKIIEFPNRYVFDFCNTAMTALYGDDWLDNNRALSHELIAPWLVVSKL